MNILNKFLSVGILLIFLSSCSSDWLDVRPQSEIIAEEQFETETGFVDAMNGVYISLANQSLYGQELTFGLLATLAQDYDLGTNNRYRNAAQYEYEDTQVRPIIDAAWSNLYNAIANLNLLIENINTVDPNIFVEYDYNLVKGESLGLRAFLYLDLLRLYAPSYASNPSALAIPYVTKYSTEITSRSSVEDVLNFIIDDLEEAVIYMSASAETQEELQLQTERYRFNYYAAKATLARAYLYKGDVDNALSNATEIIDLMENDAGVFFWTSSSAIETASSSERDRIFFWEHIFKLDVNNMADIVNFSFTSAAGVNGLLPSEEKIEEIYEVDAGLGGADWRQVYLFDFDVNRYPSKFWQENPNTNNIMPLIKISEMYYIAAECLKDTDPVQAITYLNTVRNNRNISTTNDLLETLSSEEIQDEIFKEYRKDFLCEGTLFYYYKRLNLPNIEGSVVPASDAVYVWPLPDNEIEFGN